MNTPQILPLTLTPYGVSVFTDRERQKSFVTLLFRQSKTTKSKALAFPGLVLDSLTQAGLAAGAGLEVNLTPLAETPLFRCHVEVSIRPLTASQTEFLAWAFALAQEAK